MKLWKTQLETALDGLDQAVRLGNRGVPRVHSRLLDMQAILTDPGFVVDERDSKCEELFAMAFAFTQLNLVHAARDEIRRRAEVISRKIAELASRFHLFR